MTPVKVWQERVEIPTYETGPQDIHPMFLENRVYQGSSGAVYPYGVTDTLSEQKTLKSWQAVWLENDYIKVMILPELGGRVHRAWDKVKQRDFVYHNEVIKPALVGLLGPWISGGIEFNWPQHHRPTTFMPVDFTLEAHDDGAQTVWVGETEPMHGLQVMTGFTLRPDRAALEIASRVYNGNATPRHFLWWANPAVKGGEGHQSGRCLITANGPSPLSPSPPALTTKWTTPPEWTFLAIKMCLFQPHIWPKNRSTILSARGVTMKMAVCCTLPTTILRQVKNSGVGDTVNLARRGIRV
ncbi:TPA: DUF5107 domain-containing protein [Escherichia coli]|nr:DUF5107 domain-containing protein [Escherichia coli]